MRFLVLDSNFRTSLQTSVRCSMGTSRDISGMSGNCTNLYSQAWTLIASALIALSTTVTSVGLQKSKMSPMGKKRSFPYTSALMYISDLPEIGAGSDFDPASVTPLRFSMTGHGSGGLIIVPYLTSPVNEKMQVMHRDFTLRVFDARAPGHRCPSPP